MRPARGDPKGLWWIVIPSRGNRPINSVNLKVKRYEKYRKAEIIGKTVWKDGELFLL